MRVIGYAYEADCHCVECTLKRHLMRPFSMDDPLELGRGLDENGLPYAATDREGNAIHPVFSTDEGAEYCGDCGESLRA